MGLKNVKIPDELLAKAKVLGVNFDMTVPDPLRAAVIPGPNPINNSFEPNSLEADYSKHLDALVLAGEIYRYDFQAWKLTIGSCEVVQPDGKVKRKRVTYTPDFVVYLRQPPGVIQFHETKGFMREDAQIKLVLAATLYPFEFHLVKQKKPDGFTVEIYRG